MAFSVLGIWTAGSDWDNEAEWKWSPSEKMFTFTDWYRGQPDNIGNLEHCLALHIVYRGQWSDDNCERHLHYMCERRYGKFTSISVVCVV